MDIWISGTHKDMYPLHTHSCPITPDPWKKYNTEIDSQVISMNGGKGYIISTRLSWEQSLELEAGGRFLLKGWWLWFMGFSSAILFFSSQLCLCFLRVPFFSLVFHSRGSSLIPSKPYINDPSFAVASFLVLFELVILIPFHSFTF